MENTAQSIHAEKKFSVGVNDLYDAWINADKLKQWWQPAGNKLMNVENDVREGGSIRYEFEGKDGQKTIVITGQYKEVKPAQQLVYSWNWQMLGSQIESDNPFELTIEFSGDEKESSLRVTQTAQDENEAIQPRQKGWEDELESLQQFLK